MIIKHNKKKAHVCIFLSKSNWELDFYLPLEYKGKIEKRKGNGTQYDTCSSQIWNSMHLLKGSVEILAYSDIA